MPDAADQQVNEEVCPAKFLPGLGCELAAGHSGDHEAFSEDVRRAWGCALRWPEHASEGHDHVS